MNFHRGSRIIITAFLLFITFLFCIPGLPDNAGARSGDEFYDIMIFGVDRRPHQKKGRSDVMMIVHCEPGRITLFSIPRDSKVPVRRRMDKINHAFAYGGPKLAKATVENFLLFKIDNYIAVDFETFLNTVDTIKTLTDDGKLIGAENFLADGESLLKWLRYRGLPGSDRRRCQRHQLFIRRVFDYTLDMYEEQTLLFSQCSKAGLKIVDTDLTYDHISQIYAAYRHIDVDKDVERFVLPGRGKCEWEEDEETGKRRLKAWYYIPKYYNRSLMTYIRWYRGNNMQSNYKEVDTLRK